MKRIAFLVFLFWAVSFPCFASTLQEEPYCEGTLGLTWGIDTVIKMYQNNFSYKRQFDLMPREKSIRFSGKIADNEVFVDVDFFDNALYSIFVTFGEKDKAITNYTGLKEYLISKYGSPSIVTDGFSWYTRKDRDSSTVALVMKDGTPLIEYLFIPISEKVSIFHKEEDKRVNQKKYGAL